MKVAVVGCTGLVGSMMLRLLEERNFPVTELIPVASEKSIGRKIMYFKKEYAVVSIEQAIEKNPDIALFSAGSSISLQYAPEFSKRGTFVIDNSSAWRMHEDIPLVVPEVNASVLTSKNKIIANPNCSTIQMVMVLKPLHDIYNINRVVVSTYQSVTGTGAKAVQQLMNERSGILGEMAYPYPIDLNVIPQIDVFMDNGYTKEEMKMVNETKKILHDQHIRITSTTVRIPVLGGHSESVNIEFSKIPDIDYIREILNQKTGIIVMDDISKQIYPMPLIHAKDSDMVFVGRIRKDESIENGINLWIVSDNLRKGAATNAIQIAEYILSNHWI
jgi:aspartate-semialdehyde dehydrogenase